MPTITTRSFLAAVLGCSLAAACSTKADSDRADGGPAADGRRADSGGGGWLPDGVLPPPKPEADAGLPLDTGPRGCEPACGDKQVCVDGTCKDLPSQCPCPVESYCDLGSNSCVAGCTSDEHCSAGRYCDTATRECNNGCRMVGDCGANEACDPLKRTCECLAGHHRCGGACVVEGVQSCGSQCEVCPTDPNGSTSCTPNGCILNCDDGHKMCGGACAPCPTTSASGHVCDGSQCVPSGCQSGYHICGGACELEDLNSCGASCSTCGDATEGACSGGACYGMVDLGYYPKKTSCDARCKALGKTCGDVCNVQYESNSYVMGGFYKTSWGTYGYLACADYPSSTAPTSYRCCCTEALTGTPQPECTEHDDCGTGQFCLASNNTCYPTTDSRCPPSYKYKSMCSDGTNFCVHSGLPSGTTYVFEKECPAGTTHRGGFYCSGETKVCVPD